MIITFMKNPNLKKILTLYQQVPAKHFITYLRQKKSVNVF